MSDDLNRPDADHELDVDISDFLPEGSRFATDDGELEERGPEDEVSESNSAGNDGGPENDAMGEPGDGGAPSAAATRADVSDVDDGWDTGAPAPEIPAWAIDDLRPPPEVDGSDQPVDDVSEPAPVADTGPAVPAVPEVDTTVLTRIEGELADVDAAIAAIDAGDLARSPLLTELLSAAPTPLAPQEANPVAEEPT